MRVLFSVGLASILLIRALAAESPGQPFRPAGDARELEQRITAILKENHVPGASLVTVQGSAVTWQASLGKADLASGRVVDPDTLFRIGSISKMFVGLAALRLVEEGRLRLDAPVRQLLPDLPFSNPWEATDPVRVVHLLEHTSGWDDEHLVEFAHNDPKPLTLAAALALSPSTRVSRWRPGTLFSYSNEGPPVTAAIIEKVTGQPYEAYIDASFFKPIGMDRAGFLNSGRAQASLATLYHEDGLTPYAYQHIALRPSGAMNASLRDMTAFLRFFVDRGQAGGKALLSEASLRRMETPVSWIGAQGGLTEGYGLHNDTTLGWKGFVWHGHDGAILGCQSGLAYLPSQGIGYFFSINKEGGDAFGRISKELQAFLVQGLPTPKMPSEVPVSPEMRRAFQGWYEPVNHRNQFLAPFERLLALSRLSFQGDRLKVRLWIGPEHIALPMGKGLFRSQSSSVADLVLMDTKDGKLAATLLTTFRKVSPVQAWLKIVLTSLFALALVSVILFFPIWGLRWVFRGLRHAPNLHVRWLSLLAACSWVATFGLFMYAAANVRPWTALVNGAGCAFVLFSGLALWAALRADRKGMNRWAYLHSFGASILFVIAAAYLCWCGVIGFRTWV